MLGSSWLIGGLLAFGAIDLVALDVVVAPRALAPPEVARVTAAPRPAEAPPPSREPPPPLVKRLPPPPPPAPLASPAPPAPLSPDELRPTIVYFATDRATLDAPAARALDELAARLAADPRGTVEIVGHADRRGSEPHNEELSERRMELVRDYLGAHGVSAARLRGRAAGAREPARAGTDPSALAADRRAEIRRKP
jgi:outer membrane protein OmpA-like peptidoglycan-associated protein